MPQAKDTKKKTRVTFECKEERQYQQSKDYFGRVWRKYVTFLTANTNIPFMQNTYINRFCVMRASIDHEGVDLLLQTMINNKWGKKDRCLACHAWASQMGLIGHYILITHSIGPEHA